MAEDLVVVVNAANSAPRVTAQELRRLYQGQLSRWPNQVPVRLVLPRDEDAAMGFVADLLHVGSASQVARYYLAQVFQQRANDVPPQLSAAAAVVYVGREIGAIAIVPAVDARGIPAVRALTIER